jgi:hypothetical protein
MVSIIYEETIRGETMNIKHLSVVLLFGICLAFAEPSATQPSGEGSSGSPYQISSLENLYWVSQNSTSWDKYFLQKNDIDAAACSTWAVGDHDDNTETLDEAMGWTPIGNTATKFTGHYDGGGFKISNITINRPNTENVGFFGHIGYDGDSVVIRNLHITNSAVIGARGTGTLVGRVTGDNKTLIENCSAIDGTVTGDGATGGLVGSNNSWKEKAQAATFQPAISKSYADIDVYWSRNPASSPGADKFGGLAGCNQKGKTINSYARGSVTIDNNPQVEDLIPERIGGIAGCTIYQGIIEKSYATTVVTIERELESGIIRIGGLVGLLDDPAESDKYNGTVSNSFWDTEATGLSTSAAGTGKTTELMQTQSTFTDAGWDFVTTWEIVDNNYPRIKTNRDVSLPVTLSFFTAKATKSGVLLEWETSAEIENAGFIIRRQEAGTSTTLSDRNQENGTSTSLSDRDTEDLNHQSTITNQQLIASYQTTNALVGQGSVTKSTRYTFTDTKIEAGKLYIYTLSDVTYSGKEIVLKQIEVKIESEGAVTADSFTLLPVFPNPFNARFTVAFNLMQAAPVSVEIVNLHGRKMLTIIEDALPAGAYSYQVSAADFSSGIYFLQTRFNGFRKTQKIVLLK